MKWSFGITTIPSRRDTYFPQTIVSLTAAGFSHPHVFIDAYSPDAWYHNFPLFTMRYPPVRVAGNWLLSMYELYVRNPGADRYALFQDDLVAVRNLRQYLERAPYPKRGYLNLFTYPDNQELAPIVPSRELGRWFKGNLLRKGPEGYQNGKGAVALVFNREAVMRLLSSEYLVERFQDVHRGHLAIDGGIVSAMNREGWYEYVHNPSLVQHTGDSSSIGHLPYPKAPSFPGEQFDALTLLGDIP